MSVYDLMYQDSMTVSRLVDTEQENGTIKQTRQEVAGLIDIPCRLSSIQSDTPRIDKNGRNTNPVSVVYLLFCKPELEVLAGDELEVDRLVGCVNSLIAGEPVKYVDHQQILLSRETRA